MPGSEPSALFADALGGNRAFKVQLDLRPFTINDLPRVRLRVR